MPASVRIDLLLARRLPRSFISFRFDAGHSLFHDILCALPLDVNKIESLFMYVHACWSREAECSGRRRKSGQSPILLIILQYNGPRPQMWMTFTATPMTLGEQSGRILESVEVGMMYRVPTLTRASCCLAPCARGFPPDLDSLPLGVVYCTPPQGLPALMLIYTHVHPSSPSAPPAL